MSFALARSLLLADAVTAEALSQALLVAATRGTSLVRALLATRAVDAMRLEQQLERGDAPTMRHVAPVMSLVQSLPPGLCERLLALPVRRDPRTGTIDVAVVDARDPHPVEEIAFWLRAPVRMVRTSLAAMDSALRKMQDKPAEVGPRSLAPPIWVPPASMPPRDITRTPAYGVQAATDPAPITTIPAEPPAVPLDDGLDETSITEVTDFGVAGPNIPFKLTRRSLPPLPPELRAATEKRSAPSDPSDDPIELRTLSRKPETEPVLDLRRRKSIAPSNAPPLPFPPAGPALDAIRSAPDRDSILEQVVAGMQVVARKVAVLAVRKEMLVGWTCSPELADRATLRTARISAAVSDVLTSALASDTAVLARIPKDAAHAPLLAAMKVPPAGEVALVTVRVDGKAVALVLADELVDAAPATERLQEIARVAGQALERLLRERHK
jgi:Type II secretion system (T2SS), protein E, N-terminal domain